MPNSASSTKLLQFRDVPLGRAGKNHRRILQQTSDSHKPGYDVAVPTQGAHTGGMTSHVSKPLLLLHIP